MGVKVRQNSVSSYTFQADDINLDYLHTENYQRQSTSLRGSIMIVGPLLGRFGKAYIPQPGGDKIVRRRLDTHFIGLEKLGAKFKYNTKRGLYSKD